VTNSDAIVVGDGSASDSLTLAGSTLIANAGGDITVEGNATLTLEDTASITGGNVTGSGVVDVAGSNTIQGNADVTISYINVGGGNTLTLDHVLIDGSTINLGGATGSGQSLTEISVAGLNAIGPAMSADGQFIAFIVSTGLPGQGNTVGTIELYDAANGQITDISDSTPQLPEGDTSEGFGNVPSISADVHSLQQLSALITAEAHGETVIGLGHDDSLTLSGVTTVALEAHLAHLQKLMHLL
jgi:hypothetical protein